MHLLYVNTLLSGTIYTKATKSQYTVVLCCCTQLCKGKGKLHSTTWHKGTGEWRYSSNIKLPTAVTDESHIFQLLAAS